MVLRWGIVSAGRISHDFVTAIQSHPDTGDQVIYGIVDLFRDKAEEFAKLHGVKKIFDSFKDLIESKDIDIVYIGVLNPQHYPLTKQALESGKPVLCEKPFTINQKQTQSLINLAKKKNLFLMEAIWSRFSPAYIELEKELKSGIIGEVKFLEANHGIDADAERLFKKELGGGAIFDIGIYLLNISVYIFKEEPIKVTAIGGLNESGVDVWETIILEFSGERRAVLNAQTKLQLWNNATIYGTKGRITLQDPFHAPERVIYPDGQVREYPFYPTKIPYLHVNSGGLVYEAIEVARCIKAGLKESPRMTHKDSLLLAKLMDTVRKQLGVHFDADDQEYP